MAERSNEACWYVIHTEAGYENKVKDTLEKSVESHLMAFAAEKSRHTATIVKVHE